MRASWSAALLCVVASVTACESGGSAASEAPDGSGGSAQTEPDEDAAQPEPAEQPDAAETDAGQLEGALDGALGSVDAEAEPDAAPDAEPDAAPDAEPVATCELTCSGHGSCVAGASPSCLCDPGYAEASCQSCAAGYAREPRDGRCVVPVKVTEARPTPASATCAQGGHNLIEGIDADFNGVLDDAEITKQQAICRLVRTGDVLITNEAQLESLRGVTDMTGALTIRAPFISTLEPLRSLVTVGTNLTVETSNTLTDLSGLSWLAQIGGSVIVRSNAQLVSTSGFAALKSVAKDVFIHNNPRLTAIDLGPLQVVEGSFDIHHQPVLTQIIGSRLRSVVGAVALYTMPQLTGMPAFQALRSIGGPLLLGDCDALTHVRDFGELRDVGGLRVHSNALLTSLKGLGKLTTLRGGLQVASSEALVELFGELPLTMIWGDFSFHDLPALREISGFSKLESIGGRIHLARNTQLERVAVLPALTSLGRYVATGVVQGNCWNGGPRTPLTPPDADTARPPYRNSYAGACNGFPFSTSLPSTVGIVEVGSNPALREMGGVPLLRSNVFTDANAGIRFVENPQLERIEQFYVPLMAQAPVELRELAKLSSFAWLDELGAVGPVKIEATGLTSLSFPTFTSDELTVRNNPELRSLELGALVDTRRVFLAGNRTLSTLRAPLLRTLETCEITDNAQLTSISLPVLWNVLTSLLVRGNSALTTIAWPRLSTIAGALTIDDNDALVTLPAWALVATTAPRGVVRIRGNDALQALPAMGNGPYELHIENNDALVDVSGLQYRIERDGLFASLRIVGNDALTSLGGLSVTVNGSVNVENNRALTSLSPQLLKGASYEVVGNPALTSVAGLTIGQNTHLTIRDNDALERIAGYEAVATMGSLIIRENDRLVSLRDLAALTRVTTADIVGNARLPQCAAQAFVSRLTVVLPGTVSGNDSTATCP